MRVFRAREAFAAAGVLDVNLHQRREVAGADRTEEDRDHQAGHEGQIAKAPREDGVAHGKGSGGGYDPYRAASAAATEAKTRERASPRAVGRLAPEARRGPPPPNWSATVATSTRLCDRKLT